MHVCIIIHKGHACFVFDRERSSRGPTINFSGKKNISQKKSISSCNSILDMSRLDLSTSSLFHHDLEVLFRPKLENRIGKKILKRIELDRIRHVTCPV